MICHVLGPIARPHFEILQLKNTRSWAGK